MALLGKRKRWLFSIAAVAFLAVARAPVVHWLRLPSYQGHRIDFWWREYLDCQPSAFAQPWTPELWEERQRRGEKALEAFRAMQPGAGKFLAGKFRRDPFALPYFRFHKMLPKSVAKAFENMLPPPRPPGEKQNLSHNLLARLPEAKKEAKPYLLRIVLEEDAPARGSAAWLLFDPKLDYSDSLGLVAACMKFQDSGLPEWSARKLAEFGERGSQYGPDIRAARRRNYIAASSCVRSLQSIGAGWWTSLPALNAELFRTNPAPTVALGLVRTLGNHKIQVFAGLSNAVLHPDARFAASAIKAIASLGSDARPLAPALIEALDSPWYFLRAESIGALQAIGGPALNAAMPKIRALQNDPHPGVSNAVHRVLTSIEAVTTIP